jgi:hypothetical protein
MLESTAMAAAEPEMGPVVGYGPEASKKSGVTEGMRRMVEKMRWSQRHGCEFRAPSSAAPSKLSADGGSVRAVVASPNCRTRMAETDK